MPSVSSLEDYCAKNKLKIRCSDGQNVKHEEAPFDRIICNLVLMLTENP